MRGDTLEVIKSSNRFIKEGSYLWLGNGFAEILYQGYLYENELSKSDSVLWSTFLVKDLTSPHRRLRYEANRKQSFFAAIKQVSYQNIESKHTFSFVIETGKALQKTRLVTILDEEHSFCVYDSPQYELFNYQKISSFFHE